MPDIGWQELMLVCVVAVIFVGPRELPRLVRGVTGFMRKARLMASEFQTNLMEIADSTDIGELRNSVNSIKDEVGGARLASAADPTGMLGKRMREVEATGKALAADVNTDTGDDNSREGGHAEEDEPPTPDFSGSQAVAPAVSKGVSEPADIAENTATQAHKAHKKTSKKASKKASAKKSKGASAKKNIVDIKPPAMD